MIKSNYATQLTRQIREGKRNPSVSMDNGVYKGRAHRKAIWLQKQTKIKEGSSK